MGSMAIDGLVSGLDTTSLINSLMQIEAAPQTLLKNKVSTTNSVIGALQGLNTKVASLATAAGTAAKAGSWDVYTATSTSSSVTASADEAALPSSLTFTVGAIATAQVSVSATMATFPTDPPVLTFVRADGTTTTVQADSTDLDDVTAAINDDVDLGIKAVKVNVGTVDAPSYRLQFTSSTTGAQAAFDVYLGDAAAVAAAQAGGPAVAKLVDSSQTQVIDAQDASIELWAGSSAAQTFTNASNTFTGVLTGVSFTVGAVTTEPVTVRASRDDAAVTKLVSDLVGSIGVVLNEITSRTRSTTKTDSSTGATTVTGGVLSGDSAVRNLSQQVMSAVSMPVDGFSPSEIGIAVEQDGTISFDQEKFAAALAADPARVQAIAMGIAGRVAAVATASSEPQVGVLSQKIASQEGFAKDLGIRVEDWDRRLELRRASLKRTYSALEVTLSNMQSQSSWLSQQLASLTPSS